MSFQVVCAMATERLRTVRAYLSDILVLRTFVSSKIPERGKSLLISYLGALMRLIVTTAMLPNKNEHSEDDGIGGLSNLKSLLLLQCRLHVEQI